MSATNAPFGFRPAKAGFGGTPVRQEALSIASAYSSNIFTQDPVKLQTAGVLQLAAAADSMVGIFGGVEYTAGGIYYVSPYWPASQALDSGTASIAYFWRDPTIEYLAQAGGSLTTAAIGDEADHVAGTGSTLSGMSGAYLNTSLAGAGSSNGFHLVGIADIPGNASGDAYTIMRVIINELQGLVIPNSNAV